MVSVLTQMIMSGSAFVENWFIEVGKLSTMKGGLALSSLVLNKTPWQPCQLELRAIQTW